MPTAFLVKKAKKKKKKKKKGSSGKTVGEKAKRGPRAGDHAATQPECAHCLGPKEKLLWILSYSSAIFALKWG